MNHNIIMLLETMKTKEYADYSAFLNTEDIKQGRDWYNKFSNNDSIDFIQIIGLMYYLYVHENIDFYPIELFQDTANYLCKQYYLDKAKYIEMLHEFRKMVFSTEKKCGSVE